MQRLIMEVKFGKRKAIHPLLINIFQQHDLIIKIYKNEE